MYRTLRAERLYPAAIRSEKTITREALEALLVASGLNPDLDVIKAELDGITKPDGTVTVNTANRDSLLTKVWQLVPKTSLLFYYCMMYAEPLLWSAFLPRTWLGVFVFDHRVVLLFWGHEPLCVLPLSRLLHA